MLQKWLVKEMINIKYHILLSFATKAKLIGMFDTLVDELSESLNPPLTLRVTSIRLLLLISMLCKTGWS